MEDLTLIRKIAVTLIVAGFSVLGYAIFPPIWQGVMPPFGLSALFFFCYRYRASRTLAMPLVAGILLDVAQGMPFGVGLLAALLLYRMAILAGQRIRGIHRAQIKAFWPHYLHAIYALSLSLLLIYLIMGLMNTALPNWKLPLGQLILTIVFYPLLYQLLERAMRYGPLKRLIAGQSTIW